MNKLYEIEIALAHHSSFDFKKNIVVFNVNGWSGTLPIFHKCDMLVCSKSGYLTEIEIKRTWSDFLADFKKKHKHENEGLIKYFYYCLPASFDVAKAYDAIEEHKVNYSGILFYDEYLNIQFLGCRISSGNYQNKALEGYKKLTIEQQLEIARLGAMRVIGLKEKLISDKINISQMKRLEEKNGSCRTLDLILKHKWYDMINSGIKKEEYREIKPYWTKRLKVLDRPTSFFKDKVVYRPTFKTFDAVRFHDGYSNRTVMVECDSIQIGKGKPEWGAPKDREVFIINLGEKVKQG